MRGSSLAQRLDAIRQSYLRELDSRSKIYREDPSVRKIKEGVLETLTRIAEDLPASAPLADRLARLNEQINQIQEKLQFLQTVRFGATTRLDDPKALQFRRSTLQREGFLSGIVKGLLATFSSLPELHFEEVLMAARAMLQDELEMLGTLRYSTSEEVAAGTSITVESLQAGWQETMTQAVVDFARNTRLGEKSYAGETLDEAYLTKEILAFTGEKDITKGYAGEIAHVPAQAPLGVLTVEACKLIPSLDRSSGESLYSAATRPDKLVWSKASDEIGGFYLDVNFSVIALLPNDDPEHCYCADKDLDATKLRQIDTEELKGLRSKLPPLVNIRARIRYVLPKGAERPVPRVEFFELTNRFLKFLPFGPRAQAQILGSAPSLLSVETGRASVAAGGAGAQAPHWLAPSPAPSPADPLPHHPSPASAPAAAPTPNPRVVDDEEGEGEGESGPGGPARR